MTKLPGAVWPLAVIALGLAWPVGSEYLPASGLPGWFRPETGVLARLNIHHYALCGTLLSVWLAAPRGRSANVLVSLAALAVLLTAVFRAQAEVTLALLWSLAALTATALAGIKSAGPPARRTAFGLTDPGDLDRLFGPPSLRVFKNMVLLLIFCGLAGTVYQVFGHLTAPGGLTRDLIFDSRDTSAHLAFILMYPWFYALGPWALMLALLWLGGPRPGLSWVPALGTVMLLGLGLWARYHLGPGWSDGRWLTAWAAPAGALAQVLAWAALAAAVISLVRQRFGQGEGSEGNEVETGSVRGIKSWTRLGVTVSLGAAATAVFLGACFYLGRPVPEPAPRPGPTPIVSRQLGPLEIKLPRDFVITSGQVRLPWSGRWLNLTERRLAEGAEPRPVPAEDFSEALERPARLWRTDYVETRADGRPDQFTRLTMDLGFADRGQASLSLEYAYDPRVSSARDIEALHLSQKDSFIEAVAAFLRVYRWLGPEAAAEAPFRSGYRTACGHLSRWNGRPLQHYELSPLPVRERGQIRVTLDLGYDPPRRWPLARDESGPFQAIVAYSLGLNYDRRPAGFAGRPGFAGSIRAALPRDPLYFEQQEALFRWTGIGCDGLTLEPGVWPPRPDPAGPGCDGLTLELAARPPADRSELAWIWGELLDRPGP